MRKSKLDVRFLREERETVAATGKSRLVQYFSNGRSAWVTQLKTDPHQRFIRTDAGLRVPLEIAGLAAGPDAWLRLVRVACRDCRVRIPLGELEQGFCPSCWGKVERDNEALDAGAGGAA